MADVASTLRAWSATAGSNAPLGTTVIGAGLDDNLRQLQAVVRQFLASQGTNMASAATLDLSTADGSFINVTGTTATTSLGTEAAGIAYTLRATGAWPITYNATSMIIVPQRQSITLQADDLVQAVSLGSGNWLIHPISQSDANFLISGSADNTKKGRFELDGLTTGTVRVLTVPDRDFTLNDLSAITNSLGADVALNNIASFFDGPSVAQGTSGTWFVSGTVTLTDTAGGANFFIKLYDGTTTIASANPLMTAANSPLAIAVSGFITSPAGNLRIAVKDSTSTSGKILFNNSGLSKDSTITAIRVG